jgi:3-methylcrotonyl-CoA carboxylase alpha subunit
MIAKLIVWDENRERALNRLATALAEYRIGGTVTNVEFLYNLATSRPFVEAELDTGFIERHQELLFRDRAADLAQDLPLAALALLLQRRQRNAQRSCIDPYSPWDASDAWRLNEVHRHQLSLRLHGEDHPVQIEQHKEAYRIFAADTVCTLRGELDGEQLLFERDGHRQRATLADTGDGFTLYLADSAIHFEQVLPDTGEDDGSAGGSGLTAPMNGTVVTLLVEPGGTVETDQALLVMEAMKMEHTIRAPAAGTVQAFYYQPGDLVDGGAELVDFSAAEDA